MDSVTSLMKEVELEEKDAEKSESGLDTLEKVEEFKNMLKHAKEANDIVRLLKSPVLLKQYW